MTPNESRLAPTARVSVQFGRLLGVFGAEVREPKFVNNEANQTVLQYLVPPVCAEFYMRWCMPDGELHGLKIETVARIAVEAWKAEGGDRTFMYQPRDSGAARVLETHGFIVINGKAAGEIVQLTTKQAERYRHLLKR